MKAISYFIILFLFSTKSFSQNGFDLYLSVPPTTILSSIAETPDGGFIACGSIMNSTDSTKDFYFCRYDGSGNFLWQTQISDSVWDSSPTDDYVIDIIVINGGFIFSGTIGDPNNFFKHTAVVGKLDLIGNIISILYLCDGISCDGTDLRQFLDSTVIFRYEEYQIGNHHTSPIWRFNQQFDTVWFTGIYAGYGFNNLAVSPGQYSFALGIGEDYYYSMDYRNQPLVSRFNPSGSLDWKFVFTREAFPVAYPKFRAIAGTTDNGMVICGTDSSLGNTQIF